jgi:hypothetical protein
MTEETRRHFTNAGASPSEVAAQVAAAESYFAMWNYAMQSAASALVTGTVISVIAMAFLRAKPIGRAS